MKNRRIKSNVLHFPALPQVMPENEVAKELRLDLPIFTSNPGAGEPYTPYVPLSLPSAALERLHRDMMYSAGTLEEDSQDLKDRFNQLLQKDFTELEAQPKLDFSEQNQEVQDTINTIHMIMDEEAERVKARRLAASNNKHRRRAGDVPLVHMQNCLGWVSSDACPNTCHHINSDFNCTFFLNQTCDDLQEPTK